MRPSTTGHKGCWFVKMRKVSLRGFEQVFGTCQVGDAKTLPSIGIPAIKEIIYLAASTMDLEILELKNLGPNQRRYLHTMKIESSNLLEKIRKSKF